jgi:hypothetical protein
MTRFASRSLALVAAMLITLLTMQQVTTVPAAMPASTQQLA